MCTLATPAAYGATDAAFGTTDAAYGATGAAGAAGAETRAVVNGPIPGAPPGDPKAPRVEDTYPWLATNLDLAAEGYVEQEFYVSGKADAYSTAGVRLAEDVPYRTRVLVRRPVRHFGGTVLAEWQNVTAGYDLDALWTYRQIMRAGYAWVGISAQRVGVEQLKGWSPARYGDLDVTGGGRFTADELSYSIYAQAAKALSGRLKARTLLGVGASQSASRMTVYYDAVLPQTESVFDAFAYVVGPAPSRAGREPVFQVLSETDVRSPARPPERDGLRRWEVAGAAHSGWHGQEYRQPLLARDLGQAPTYECARPPFSRVPLQHVIGAAYAHLVRWARDGVRPPTAPPLEFNADGTKARDELGLARGGIRLSQVQAPTALNTGDNSGQTFCVLFGTHVPFSQEQLERLYPAHGDYVAAVVRADVRNLKDGYLLLPDAHQNLVDTRQNPAGTRQNPADAHQDPADARRSVAGAS